RGVADLAPGRHAEHDRADQQRHQHRGQEERGLHRRPGALGLCCAIHRCIRSIMRPFRFAVFIGLLLAGLAALGLSPAAAIMWKDYTRAIAEAESRKDYQLAFTEALVLALAGENTGYDLLARYYAAGTVVPADAAVAARIVCLAAERGDRNAQIRLA